MTFRNRLDCFFAALMIGAGVVMSEQTFAQSDPIANPDPRLQSYYRENADEIRRLQKVVEDKNAPVDQRKKALQELAFKFEDVALPLAAGLVSDPAIDLARDAVSLLSNSVVLANHGDQGAASHAGDHQSASVSPWSKYTAAQHDLARDALRNAMSDSRSDIRAAGLRGLLPLSDEVALKLVQEGAQKGEITDTQAVRLCAQAISNSGRSCVLGYLNDGSSDAKTAAIDVLGSIPTYRPMVRNKIFFNSSGDPKVRAAAATVLSRYDPLFTTYALTVTADPKTPPEVYTSTLEGYARSAAALGKLDSVQRFAIDKALTNYKVQLQSEPLKNAEYLKSLDAASKALNAIQ